MSKKVSIKILVINMLMFLITIPTSIYLYLNVSHYSYNLIFLHPITYLIVFMFVLCKATFTNRIRIFFLIFTFTGFLRYVLLPLLTILIGYYGGRSQIPPDGSSVRLAIILMIYELIIIGIVIFYNERKISKNNYTNLVNFTIDEKKPNTFYYIFITLTIILLIIRPTIFNQISLLIPSFSNIELNTFDNLILHSFNISKNLLYILSIKKLYRKYNNSNNEKYILLSFIISLINMIIYVGSSRIDVIIPAVISMVILIYFYRIKVIKYLLFTIPIVIFIFIAMTEYREYVSISGNANQLLDITDTLQIYTGGVYNVSMAIETFKAYPYGRSIGVLMMDIFRSMIGFNVIFSRFTIPYSNMLFNQRIWLDVDRRSQIIPLIGQGYLLFGPIFSVLFHVVFIKLHYILEKISYKTTSLEVFYFITLTIGRMGMLMGQNTMNILNDLSMNLFLFLIVYYINKYFKFRSE